MKPIFFEIRILTKLSILTSPESIPTIFAMTSVCLSVSAVTQIQQIVEGWNFIFKIDFCLGRKRRIFEKDLSTGYGCLLRLIFEFFELLRNSSNWRKMVKLKIVCNIIFYNLCSIHFFVIFIIIQMVHNRDEISAMSVMGLSYTYYRGWIVYVFAITLWNFLIRNTECELCGWF